MSAKKTNTFNVTLISTNVFVFQVKIVVKIKGLT